MNKCHTGSDGNVIKFSIMHSMPVKVPKNGNHPYNVTRATTATTITAATKEVPGKSRGKVVVALNDKRCLA